MTSPLERAAQALARTDYPPEPAEDDWRFLVPAVRAVLTAIREPSIDIIMAGSKQVENGDGELHRRKWQAMIDAALSEQ